VCFARLISRRTSDPQGPRAKHRGNPNEHPWHHEGFQGVRRFSHVLLRPSDRSRWPEWVTVQEAAFLVRVAPAMIEGWSKSGAIGSTQLWLGRAAIVLVRSEVLRRAPLTEHAPAVATWFGGPNPKGHPGSRSRAWLAQFAASAFIVLVAISLLIQHVIPSTERSPGDLAGSEQLTEVSQSLRTGAMVTRPARTSDQATTGQPGGSHSAPTRHPSGNRASGPSARWSPSTAGDTAPLQIGLSITSDRADR
jgi:hypothetical protein